MIDWYNLAANSLWILALALALAAISFARWEAVQRREKLGQILNQRGWQVALHLAGVLFSLGLAATSDVGWERIVWLAMTIVFGVQMVWTAKNNTSTLPTE